MRLKDIVNPAYHHSFRLVAAVWLAIAVLATPAEAQDNYTVTISEENLRIVHVDAVLRHRQGLLTVATTSRSMYLIIPCFSWEGRCFSPRLRM